jgi:hypothetical protein
MNAPNTPCHSRWARGGGFRPIATDDWVGTTAGWAYSKEAPLWTTDLPDSRTGMNKLKHGPHFQQAFSPYKRGDAV